MSRAPLRTALWALSGSVALTIVLLTVSPFPGQTQLPPAASLTSDDHVDSSLETSGAPLPSDDNDTRRTIAEQTAAPAGRISDDVESQPDSVVIPDSRSIPVTVVSRPEESALAIGLEEAFNPVSGNGEFVELPPPPEYDTAAAEQAASQPHIALDELISRLQTNFDDLHSEFDRLQEQFLGLQGQFTDQLTAVQSSHGDMRRALSDLVVATNSRTPPPPLIEIEVTLLLMPLRGGSRDGALTLMSGRSSGFRVSIQAEIVDGIQWATCPSDATALQNWLQLHGRAQFQLCSTLQLEQQTVAELDLSQPTTRGMVQARGVRIHERTMTLPREEALAIRTSTTPGGLVDVELRVESSQDWRRASLSPGGTLILTAVLDEEFRPLDALSSVTPQAAAPGVASRRAAVAELIALLEPRLLTAPAAMPTPPKTDVASPFLFEQSTTR